MDLKAALSQRNLTRILKHNAKKGVVSPATNKVTWLGTALLGPDLLIRAKLRHDPPKLKPVRLKLISKKRRTVSRPSSEREGPCRMTTSLPSFR
jgi:hypothetical protein